MRKGGVGEKRVRGEDFKFDWECGEGRFDEIQIVVVWVVPHDSCLTCQ